MPFWMGAMGSHDDSSHQGSAKRDVAQGVAGLDARANLIVPATGGVVDGYFRAHLRPNGVARNTSLAAAWTSRTSAAAQQWYSVCWSPELGIFVATSTDGLVGVQVMTSPDGLVWTSRTSAAAQQWSSVCWSPELGIFVATSIDGLVAVQVMTNACGRVFDSR